MACGPELINAVAATLTPETPRTSVEIQGLLVGHYSQRAIRYALKSLIESAKAVRIEGQYQTESGQWKKRKAGVLALVQ